ncbi:MAG TPA: hypothetical protein VK939_05295 [Longimicrobiales bacterium]|nr:hypothetical protein [Longimicrobiales bacterium]
MRSSRKTRGTPVLYVLLGVLALVGAAGMAAGRGRTTASGYAPAAAVPRMSGDPLELGGVAAVGEFDWRGDDLLLLDPLERAVTVLRSDSRDGWRVLLRFGRYGGGPGELLRPSGVARLRDPARIAVADQGRMHFFDTLGVHLESMPIDIPCAMPLPGVASAAHGIFVHGDCRLRSPAGDTVYAVLFWSRDGREYVEVARDARYTTDGRFGTIFGARSAFTPGPDHHLFGSGIANCVWRVLEMPQPEARRHCDLQERAFSLVLRAETRRALAARRRFPAAGIPGTHAWYEERVPGRPDLLLRAFREDSLVVRRLDGREDLAVLPFLRLIGCRAGGCLYAEPVDPGVRLRLLSAAALADVARTARGARAAPR